jgi:ferric-dicitrate binding protein FerR (iron transport regulator)
MSIKKQNETMNRDSKADTENREETICAEALRVVNAVGYPAATQQMNDSKEEIYARVVRKIHAEAAPNLKKRQLFRHICAACITLLIVSTTAYTTYRLGFRSGNRVATQNTAEVAAPYGAIARITLPDGSSVTLNGGSRLTYPTRFDGNRQVRLSGEGFFDVVKDKTTFTVNTTHISAKVLGTRFGFKAYDDDPYTALTLEEGRIKALLPNRNADEGVVLESTQQLILNNETGEIKRQTVDAQEYVSWKDGILIFRDLTLGEIAVVLKRRFDVDIRIASGKIKNESYVAQFKHQENIEQVLDKLSYKRSWKYARHDNMIEITEK